MTVALADIDRHSVEAAGADVGNDEVTVAVGFDPGTAQRGVRQAVRVDRAVENVGDANRLDVAGADFDGFEGGRHTGRGNR